MMFENDQDTGEMAMVCHRKHGFVPLGTTEPCSWMVNAHNNKDLIRSVQPPPIRQFAFCHQDSAH